MIKRLKDYKKVQKFKIQELNLEDTINDLLSRLFKQYQFLKVFELRIIISLFIIQYGIQKERLNYNYRNTKIKVYVNINNQRLGLQYLFH